MNPRKNWREKALSAAILRNKVVGRAPSFIVNRPSAAENEKNGQKETGQNVCRCIATSGNDNPAAQMSWIIQ